MATWECRECTAAYAPGAPACPQCGTNDPIKEAEQLEKERDEMPKITVHGGPSNVDAEPGEPGHVPAEGVEPTEVEESAVETVDEGTDEGTEDDEAVDYGDFTVEELRSELADRDLPVSGNKPELVKRLADDDAAKLQAAGQDSAE